MRCRAARAERRGGPVPENRWSDEHANSLDALDCLVYRSRLIGSDPTLVNYGGGNTSSKLPGKDHAGRAMDTLWIKGSGSDLATVERHQFTPLNLSEVRLLASRDYMTDEEMVAYLRQCALDASAPRPSIETLLHAFLPFPHVDHTHADAALAFCCAEHGEALTRLVFGNDVVWVPYVRPGFGLARLALAALESNPEAHGMFLANHGLVTWGASGEESYGQTIQILQRAEEYIERRVNSEPPGGDRVIDDAADQQRREAFAHLLPVIRGRLSLRQHVILHIDDSPEIREFVAGAHSRELALTGAACPDHVLYTKFVPLVIEIEPCRSAVATGDTRPLEAAILQGIDDYERNYASYFEENADPGVAMLDPAPRIVLIPGFGLIAAGRDALAAANAAALYHRAIAVMRGASAIDSYVSLAGRDVWDIEYWPLELVKLQRQAPDRDLRGRVALVTGGAGGIGRAIARRFVEEEAHVVIADIDAARACDVAAKLQGEFGRSRICAVGADVRDECATDRMLDAAVLAYGGVDIVVANAGLASAGPIEETTLDDWHRVHDVLAQGYFLTCRAAFRLFKRQGLGGALVLNSSKNGLAPGKNALPYTTAKAAELHMARCLAEEGGAAGIRVNAVAPDAIIAESGLWTREWREERAKAYGFDVEDIEEFYRQRSVLKRSVRARDVAEAVLFLVSDRSTATTGCIITVDGGNAGAYPR